MDRFFDEVNIARYRGLLDPSLEERQRATILQQLGEEEEKFRRELRLNRNGALADQLHS